MLKNRLWVPRLQDSPQAHPNWTMFGKTRSQRCSYQLVKSHITFQRAANKENLVLPLQSPRQKALVQVSTRLLDFPVNATPNAERLTKVENWCNKL